MNTRVHSQWALAGIIERRIARIKGCDRVGPRLQNGIDGVAFRANINGKNFVVSVVDADQEGA